MKYQHPYTCSVYTYIKIPPFKAGQNINLFIYLFHMWKKMCLLMDFGRGTYAYMGVCMWGMCACVCILCTGLTGTCLSFL